MRELAESGPSPSITLLFTRSRCVRSRRSWALRRTPSASNGLSRFGPSPGAFPKPKQDEKQTLTNQFRDAIQSKDRGGGSGFRIVSSFCFDHARRCQKTCRRQGHAERAGRKRSKTAVVGHRRRAGEAEFSGAFVFGIQCLHEP